jgi:hypothetical protein
LRLLQPRAIGSESQLVAKTVRCPLFACWFARMILDDRHAKWLRLPR